MSDAASTDGPASLPEIDWGAEGIETELGWAVSGMYQGYSRSAIGAVSDVPGGPRGYQVLVAITTEQPSSQLALAHRLGIDKTQMTYVIDALETGGFVERRPDPRDRRIRQVNPTEAGRALLSSSRVALREREGVLLRHLSPEEQTQLRRLMARVALGAGDIESCIADAEAADAARAAREQPLAAPDRSRRSAPSTPTD
ncbi:MarR family winged helix-turn-helix transcriptional regulator [Herbiconiux liukaitaii]|uniref:MarR family winged helix-turn-helix transcriptional regulator n=1 Tax=Herbiconiux liukaitaii TaxID=3342799 RepID=UPI0035B875A7